MKKIYLLIVAFALVFSSCSDDDTRDRSTLKVTVDGILRTYNNITVEQENQTIDDSVVSVLKIKASSLNHPSDYIEFGVNESELGSTPVVHYFYFVSGNQTFVTDNQYPGQFSMVITENGHRVLKGAFNGRVIFDNESEIEQKNINGDFNVYF